MLTQEIVRELLDYDSETGRLFGRNVIENGLNLTKI